MLESTSDGLLLSLDIAFLENLRADGQHGAQVAGHCGSFQHSGQQKSLAIPPFPWYMASLFLCLSTSVLTL